MTKSCDGEKKITRILQAILHDVMLRSPMKNMLRSLLLTAIPALPRDCPGGRCTAHFPSNLSFEQEIGEGTILKDFWIISCKACGLQLKRCIGEWPVVGQT